MPRPTDTRTTVDERATLDDWLEFHRATLAWKCEGLDAAQLRCRAVPPSSLSLLGLVRHMAEVERSWFRRIFRGEDAPPHFVAKDNRDGDFDDVDTADPDEAFAVWRAEIDEARRIAAGAGLDDVGRVQRRGADVSMRWILVHMIEEYARHNGHADLLRERIDGATGD